MKTESIKMITIVAVMMIGTITLVGCGERSNSDLPTTEGTAERAGAAIDDAAAKTAEAARATAEATKEATGQAVENTGAALEKTGAAVEKKGAEMQQ